MIEEILDQCLKEIRDQRATVSDCLKKYPEYARELEPLLEMARTLQAAPDVKPSAAFKMRTRARLVQLSPPVPPRRIPLLFPRFSFATASAIALAVLGLGVGLVYAAADSLPDSPLYPIKRGTEAVQVLLAADPESVARMHMTLAERRLSEAQALAGKSEQNGLTEQTVDEYSNQVNASLQAVPAEQNNPTPLTQELTDRLTRQQDDLRALEKKVSAPVLEKANSGLQKAKDKLKSLVPPLPNGAPVVAPSPLPLPPATDAPALPTILTVPSAASSPVLSTPALDQATPPVSLPTLPVPSVPAVAPTVLPKPPADIPPAKPPADVPPPKPPEPKPPVVVPPVPVPPLPIPPLPHLP